MRMLLILPKMCSLNLSRIAPFQRAVPILYMDLPYHHQPPHRSHTPANKTPKERNWHLEIRRWSAGQGRGFQFSSANKIHRNRRTVGSFQNSNVTVIIPATPSLYPSPSGWDDAFGDCTKIEVTHRYSILWSRISSAHVSVCRRRSFPICVVSCKPSKCSAQKALRCGGLLTRWTDVPETDVVFHWKVTFAGLLHI